MTLNNKRQPITRDYQRCVVYLPKWAKDIITEQAEAQSVSTSKYIADTIMSSINIEEAL